MSSTPTAGGRTVTVPGDPPVRRVAITRRLRPPAVAAG